ncbi:hypothetical protein B6U93_00665 [Candidatus Woesearchaeota archaeon ex4484_78]|nr:MAG: hypothetical protein B6U93_00665 [Candidatus Woesearchaeota archaeon ex4484_78]
MDEFARFVEEEFNKIFDFLRREADEVFAYARVSFNLLVYSDKTDYGRVDSLVLAPLPDYSYIKEEDLIQEPVGLINYSNFNGYLSENELLFDDSFVASRDEVVNVFNNLVSVIKSYEQPIEDEVLQKRLPPVSIKGVDYFSLFKTKSGDLLLPENFSRYYSNMPEASVFLGLLQP